MRIEGIEVKEILNVLPQNCIDWGTKLIGADKAWGKYRGRGIKVGIIDTGIDYNHPDLNVVECVSFIDDTDGYDSGFHGTHVSGIIAGMDNNIGIIGVAPEAELYVAKIFDKNDKTNEQAKYNALRWMIDKKVHVINMSFGGYYLPELPGQIELREKFHSVIKEVYSAGIIMVAAAGNSGNPNDTLDRIAWPARFPEVFAVGAICQELQRAGFSSAGPGLDFAMPGVDVYSCYPGGQWARFSGTSMAAPYLTGCIALLQEHAFKEKGRMLNFEEVKRELIKYSMDLGVEGIDPETGHGLVNIGKIGTSILHKSVIQIDPPMILDSKTWRTLAPVRFLVEINGGQILKWDGGNRIVTFLTHDQKKVTMQVGNNKVSVETQL